MNEIENNELSFVPENEEMIELQTIENKDDVYRLEEMSTEMEQSINNVVKVLDNQKQLVEYVAKAEGNVFESLVNELNMSNTNLESQLNTMNTRHDLLIDVLTICKDNELVKDAVNKLLAALGVFRQ